MKDITITIKGKKVTLTEKEASEILNQLRDMDLELYIADYVDDASWGYVIDKEKKKKAVKFIKSSVQREIWGEVDELLSYQWIEFVNRYGIKEKACNYA